jgi:hypothetical protein
VLADVAAQAEQLDRDDDLRSAADRARVEHGALGVLDRLRGQASASVVVVTTAGVTLRGRPSAVGPDWVALDREGTTTVVPAHAVAAVRGLGPHAVPLTALGGVDRRKDLRYVLRAVQSDGAQVLAATAGRDLRGHVTRVGADYVDVTSDGETWSLSLAAVDYLVV